jgi:glutathione S-transferase
VIDVWGRRNAYNVQKVLWTLAELELEHTHHELGSLPGELDTPRFLALNPHARIPVLRQDDDIVWESNSIIRYLSASYSHGELWPDDVFQRSRAERWMDWELTRLQPDFIELFWGYYRTPPDARDQGSIDTALVNCAAHFQQLSRQLEQQPYLAGEHFTMGDIPCAVSLYRYFEMGLDVDQPVHVMQWYRRLSQRSAFKETVTQPFDELKGRIEF